MPRTPPLTDNPLDFARIFVCELATALGYSEAESYEVRQTPLGLAGDWEELLSQVRQAVANQETVRPKLCSSMSGPIPGKKWAKPRKPSIPKEPPMEDLLVRFLTHVREASNRGALPYPDPFTEAECWKLVSLGFAQARADSFCPEGHHFLGHGMVSGPIKPAVECNMCEEPSFDPEEHFVQYMFIPQVGPVPMVTEGQRGLQAVLERTQAFNAAYPPTIFPSANAVELSTVPPRIRRDIWVEAVRYATDRILAARP